MSTSDCCLGALALECSAPLAHLSLPRAEAAQLGDHVAGDLARLLRDVEKLDLAVAAAAFDPSELLRPGWPVHEALAELVRRAPASGGPRVLGFGNHDGRMPPALAPDPALRDGPLRLVPFVLRGESAAIEAMRQRIEEVLLNKGMAQAATSFFVQKAFNAALEHVRFLSLDDLVAMISLQYEHVGLAPLWPLIEAALFTPEREVWLDAPPEPLLRWDGEKVRMAELDPPTWRARGYAPAGISEGRIELAWKHFRMRQQQYAAVLAAHAIALQLDPVAPTREPRAALSD